MCTVICCQIKCTYLLTYLPISIIPENLTSIGQSVLDLLNKIAKFDGHYHKTIELIYLPISITSDNLTSIGQSVLELLSKITKFDLLTSDKSAILNRASSQIIPENLTSIGQSVLELLSKIAKFDLG